MRGASIEVSWDAVISVTRNRREAHADGHPHGPLNSASVASVLLLTEATVTEIPEPKESSQPTGMPEE